MPIAWQLYRDIENPEMFVYTNDSTENMTDETRDPRFGHDGRRLRSKLQPFEPEHREDLPTSYVSTQPWSCNNSCKGLPIGTESSGTPWTPSSGSTFRLGSDQLPGEDLSESPPQTDSDENAPSASIRHGLSLDQLRAVEKHPRHEWSEDERLLLCIMYRWFEGDIPPVFNAITGLKLKDGTIKKQFQDHLVLYGEKAFPNSFGKIFKSTPFADTKAYNDIRSIIESEAQKIGADLRRRLVEQVFSSGRAENARSEYTRQTYRTLVDRAAQMTLDEQLTTNLTSSLEEVTQGIQSSNETGGFLETEGHQILLPPAQSFHTGSSPGTPCLAFRVWDDHSRTMFRDGGFVADLFEDRRGPITQPIPKEDCYDIFDVLSHSHMSFHGNASAFVSVASSLLQVLKYAANMSNPRIAIINLKHPDLTVPHKVHHARDIIKRLQERGEMPWTKYKGACEWLVWGNVPSTAILHISELTELDNLVEQSEDVNNLLQLHMFSSNARTRTIAQRLQNRNCTLNIDAAKAMGQIAELFGLGSVNATPDHIKEFVANLVDGWSIKPTSVNDIRSLDFLALHFTTTLNPRGSYRLHDVIEAFVQGVLKGSENLAHFGRGRRNNLTHSNNLR